VKFCYLRTDKNWRQIDETSDRTNTALSSVFIDGTNNVLEFRKASRSSATDYALQISGNAYSGMPGIAIKDGAINLISTTSSGGSYWRANQLSVESINANSNAISGNVSLASGDVSGSLVGIATGNASGYSVGVAGIAGSGGIN